MLSGGEETHHLLGDLCDNTHLALSHVGQNHIFAPHSFQSFHI